MQVTSIREINHHEDKYRLLTDGAILNLERLNWGTNKWEHIGSGKWGVRNENGQLRGVVEDWNGDWDADVFTVLDQMTRKFNFKLIVTATD